MVEKVVAHAQQKWSIRCKIFPEKGFISSLFKVVEVRWGWRFYSHAPDRIDCGESDWETCHL